MHWQNANYVLAEEHVWTPACAFPFQLSIRHAITTFAKLCNGQQHLLTTNDSEKKQSQKWLEAKSFHTNSGRSICLCFNLLMHETFSSTFYKTETLCDKLHKCRPVLILCSWHVTNLTILEKDTCLLSFSNVCRCCKIENFIAS